MIWNLESLDEWVELPMEMWKPAGDPVNQKTRQSDTFLQLEETQRAIEVRNVEKGTEMQS